MNETAKAAEFPLAWTLYLDSGTAGVGPKRQARFWVRAVSDV